ncbi:MAG: hypothetical protein KatS3mg044_1331 [Rhodothermaceae bacterium]|nr:MAG: DUF4293 family protein [Bacteroidota bacterium]GIV62465.1 MAG: hypothetical protein KatS3mg044_1331 [Rhodothermaceae bacterium]
MIQRIQSLYLLLGAVLMAVVVFGLGAYWNLPLTSAGWLVPAFRVLGSLTVLVGVAAIFLYKDRSKPGKLLPGLRRQRKIVVGVQVLTVLAMAALFAVLYLARRFQVSTDPGGMAVLALPVAAYVCFYLARLGIDRDIRELVKADQFRLRD